MTHTVTLIPGDGIGPEVVAAARRVAEASGAAIDWDVQLVGSSALEAGAGQSLPPEVTASIAANGVALKGPVTTSVGGFPSANLELRRRLDVYAQARYARTWPGVPEARSGVDLVVVRETTEDLYAGIEFAASSPEAEELRSWLANVGIQLSPAAALAVKPSSLERTRRAVTYAFELASHRPRRRVTVAHKATVMPHTDGLYLQAAEETAPQFGDVTWDDCLVDNLVARLVRHPQDFDVLVMPNMYGDIVSDLAAALVGGIGLMPGVNVGSAVTVFEPAHGSAPRHAGTDRCNPTAMILCAALLLRHIGEGAAAEGVEQAVGAVLAEATSVTYDVKPDDDGSPAVGTAAFTDAVISRMGAGS